MIIKQGETGHEFYLICSGLVKVLITDIHINGNQKQVATLKTGDTFGETSLITDKPNAFIQCMQDTKMLYCDKYTFLAITNKNQKKKVNMQQYIVNEYDQKEGKEDLQNNALPTYELLQRLNEYGLSRFATPLVQDLGVESLSDLKYCDTSDLQRIGCKVVQIKKLKEIAQKYEASQKMNCNDPNRGNSAYI